MLNISVAKLMKSQLNSEHDLGIFRSNVSHHLKNTGDIDFMIELLESNDIRIYWNNGMIYESLYLLSTLDYLSRKHDIPICRDYNDIRCHKFEKPIFPSGVLLEDEFFPKQNIKQLAIDESIPEFLEHGIIERSLYDSA